ncbi:MAG: molybdenum cofactor biosynthesis protein MoaE [Gemmatimonadaceae bacterium]
MTTPYVALVHSPIDVARLQQRVSNDDVGAITLFIGTVRNLNDGRAVTGIDYEAYDAMALRELEAVASEIVAKMPDVRLAIEHRLGTLVVGEISVAIAAGHARRAIALDASCEAIEAIKRRAPIWKREHYADGDWCWVDPTKSSGNVQPKITEELAIVTAALAATMST